MENTNERRENGAHLAAEPARTELLLSGDGVVLWFGLIVCIVPAVPTGCEELREDAYVIWILSEVFASASAAGFHTGGWCFSGFCVFVL